MTTEIKRKDMRLGIKGWIYGGKYWMERYGYLFHRITGLALVFYLFLHIFVTGERTRGERVWSKVMEIMEKEYLEFLEFLLLVAFIYHAINGLRLIFTEFGFFTGKPAPPKYPYKMSIKAQRPFMYLLMFLAAVFIIISALDFFQII